MTNTKREGSLHLAKFQMIWFAFGLVLGLLFGLLGHEEFLLTPGMLLFVGLIDSIFFAGLIEFMSRVGFMSRDAYFAIGGGLGVFTGFVLVWLWAVDPVYLGLIAGVFLIALPRIWALKKEEEFFESKTRGQ